MVDMIPEQAERIRVGEQAAAFLSSPEWNDLVKPIIDSMLRGLTDIRGLSSAVLSSESKAKVEVMARKLAADYLSEIQTLIEGYVVDRDTVVSMLDKREGKSYIKNS